MDFLLSLRFSVRQTEQTANGRRKSPGKSAVGVKERTKALLSTTKKLHSIPPSCQTKSNMNSRLFPSDASFPASFRRVLQRVTPVTPRAMHPFLEVDLFALTEGESPAVSFIVFLAQRPTEQPLRVEVPCGLSHVVRSTSPTCELAFDAFYAAHVRYFFHHRELLARYHTTTRLV